MQILWPIAFVSTWIAITAIMFVFTMGSMSPMDGAPMRKEYWKWSLLLSLYFTIPVLGWIVGAIHLYIVFKKKPEHDQLH